jgi:transposase-like protein
MDIVNEVIRGFIPQLNKEEKRRLLDMLIAALDAELVDSLTEADDDRVVCPRCGCMVTMKKGRSKGHQRWLCGGCARTFGRSTDRVLGLSRLSREIWVEYARCMMDMLTLRECAKRCGVCLKTSFFMRHRICECMGGYLDPFRVGPSCSAEIDEIYLRESLKGNHKLGTRFKMPRKPKRRPKDGVTGGTTKDLVCILTGINDRGAVFLEIAGMGRFCLKDAERMLADKVSAGSIVSTDDHHAYKKALREIGVATHNHYKVDSRSQGVINAVNSLHARFRDFLDGFHGISSRWLENYLTWFKWIESLRLRDSNERMEKAVAHAANGYYKIRMRDCWDQPYLFEVYAEVLG